MNLKIKRIDRKRDKTENIEKISHHIYRLLSNLYSESPWTEDYIIKNIQNEYSGYYLAEIDEQLVGFLSVHEIMDSCEITHLAVRKEDQRKGIAQLLLNKRLNDTDKFLLEVRKSNEKAQQLYMKNGFETYHVRKNYYKNPSEDAILMKKEG
ncbi:MAG: ribosomal protein S18-alanine N-acetyltransferase [Streptococcaceae bacterium]|nr:ribosomal protein S18-alanine N-acetyltransferase [Streptococcaceae bacterium]MCL2858207.1 ribosomal protein S18-alanine N-acetyltransferase [Streptococcaceae bacterium]